MEADPATLKRLVSSPDTFEKSIRVYTYEGAEILEKFCETPGWPNVTHDGEMMYDNTFSTDRDTVVEWAINNARAGVTVLTRQVQDLLGDLREVQRREADHRANFTTLGGDPAELPTQPALAGESAWDQWEAEELRREIAARMTHFYGQTDGTMRFPSSAEGDLLRMVQTLMRKETSRISTAEARPRP
jgi:hypothetical protein